MKRVLVTGASGFVGTYICQELLDKGYEVVGIDNFSKYGEITRPHDNHKNYTLVKGDAKDLENELLNYASSHNKGVEFLNFDYIISLAALIGGISYFHEKSFDLFSENEKIMCSTFDFALDLYKKKILKRMMVFSSSMVFESVKTFPTKEFDIHEVSSPLSSYGQQKLMVEWWAKAAEKQYKMPYTIIRPFNCLGAWEEDFVHGKSSHVLPDLVYKTLVEKQEPLHILGQGNQIRCYTNGKDIARGTLMALESEKAINEDFNISIATPTTVIELAEKVWNKINPDKQFDYICDDAFEYDVQKRIPDISKAKEVLGFEANISLDQSIEEVIQYMKERLNIK